MAAGRRTRRDRRVSAWASSRDGGRPPTSPEPRPPSSGEQCAEEAIRGELVPLDLLLVLDASGSMNLSVGNQTRWQLVTEALGDLRARSPLGRAGRRLPDLPLHHPREGLRDQRRLRRHDTETGRECARPFLCIGPGVLPATARTCDPNDPYCPDAGTRCVPSGRCSPAACAV